METVAQGLSRNAADLTSALTQLLEPDVLLRDINEPCSSVVFVGPPFSFPDLTLDKKRLQSQLNEQYRHFFALARALLGGQSDDVMKRLDEREKTVRKAVEQEHLVWWSTTGRALAATTMAIEEVLAAVDCLHDPAEGSVVFVPDTNALLASPILQDWRFDGIDEFEVLLVPMLLSELDGMKIGHRNEAVREKAQSLIRQVKEYGRRGRLDRGVIIVSGRIRLRTFAQEPRVADALPWLDPSIPDDRILASTVEAMRVHPRSVVALVTGDINLQNKAAFAGVPFIEAPIVERAGTSSKASEQTPSSAAASLDRTGRSSTPGRSVSQREV